MWNDTFNDIFNDFGITCKEAAENIRNNIVLIDGNAFYPAHYEKDIIEKHKKKVFRYVTVYKSKPIICGYTGNPIYLELGKYMEVEE